MWKKAKDILNIDTTELETIAKNTNTNIENIFSRLVMNERSLLDLEKYPQGPLVNIINEVNKTKFNTLHYLNDGKIKKKVLFNIIAISFGSVITLSITLQQSYVNNLNNFDPKYILMLFGLGLGIDSVKQIIEKLKA